MQYNSKKYKITSNATVYQPGEIVEVTKRVYGGLEISNGGKEDDSTFTLNTYAHEGSSLGGEWKCARITWNIITLMSYLRS